MKRIGLALVLWLAASCGVSAQVAGTLQSAAVANGNGNVLIVAGLGTAVFTVNCATCSGGTTVNFEGTQDGINYAALVGSLVGTSTSSTSTTTAGIQLWQLSVAGLANVRARISGYSAGTITVTASAVPAGGASGGGGGGGGGGAVTQGTVPWVVGQATGTNLHMVCDSGCSGGGGGGAVTIVDGGDVTQGAIADAAAAAGGTGTVSAKLREATALLNSILTGVTGAIPAGANVIGGVTESGTWNITNISGTVSLPTGAATSALQTTGNTALTTINTTLGTPMQNSGGSVTANLGTIGTAATAANQSSQITQETTTATNTTTLAGAVTSSVVQSNTKQVNGVTTLAGAGATGTGSQRMTVAQDTTTVAGSASVPAGTNLIGKVGIDQTTPGTTNGVALSSINITATDCSSTVTTGGTAQNAFTAQTTLHGFTIKNIDASAGSGEPLWISFTTTAAANTAASYPLAAPTVTTFASGESFTAPPGFGLNHALSVIAATTGHKYSCTWW